MKGQILSRIQSYQNIPSNYGTNYNRVGNNLNPKLVNETKILKYPMISAKQKQSPDRCLKILSPQQKLSNLSNHRLLLTGTSSNTNKKLLNTSSNKDIKRSLNFQLKITDKSNQGKYCNIPKKTSEKLFPIRSFSRNIEKQFQNQPNKNNFLNSPKQETQQYRSININNCKILNLQLIKEANKVNLSRRKQIMKIYNKHNINKTGSIGVGSEKNIRNLESNQDAAKDPQINNLKSTNYMMKTVNVLKDYKQSPYFNFSNKKFSVKSPYRKGPTKSLNKIPTSFAEQQEEVSIQIITDQKQKQKQKRKQKKQQMILSQYLQFGCSEIKQKQIDNDSSFLEQGQKNLINQLDLDQNSRKQQSKRKKWKKLPNDFLKN